MILSLVLSQRCCCFQNSFFSIVKNFEKHYQKLFFNSDRFFEKFLLLKSNSRDLKKSRLRFFITLLALKLAQQNEKEIQLYDGSFLPLCIGWSYQYANFITDEYAFAKRKVVWAISGFFKSYRVGSGVVPL